MKKQLAENAHWHRYRGYWGRGPKAGDTDDPCPEQCCFSVADGGRSVCFHRCPFRGVELIAGLMWCKRHAKTVRGEA